MYLTDADGNPVGTRCSVNTVATMMAMSVIGKDVDRLSNEIRKAKKQLSRMAHGSDVLGKYVNVHGTWYVKGAL